MSKFTFILFFSIIISIKSATEIEARIRKLGDQWLIETGPFSDVYQYIATAFYTNSLEETGWDFLSITTNNFFDDKIQAEAAGRLEGSLTKDRIFNHYTNMLSTAGALKTDTYNFFKRQEEFLLSKKDEYGDNSILFNAYLLYLQFNGLRDQYNKEVSEDKQIDPIEFNVMNSFGDVFDIDAKYDKPSFDKMTGEEIYNYFLLNNHCSAIFKVNPNLSDIFFGHDSWYYYNMMTRIFKEYNFNFNDRSIKAHNVMFSSYPGSIVSNDDFYLTSKGLVVIETTNSNYNESSYDLISEESLLCWQRVQLSNRMAKNAKEWTNIFSQFNSGTYNNYTYDPFSQGKPTESIAARGDLREKNPICFGAFDSKLSSVRELKENSTKNIYLYSGATKMVKPLLNFTSKACQNVKHIGIPDEPNNEWIIFNNKYNFEE